MTTVDWVLATVPILVVLGVAVYTKRFVRSVADFLAGGRCAGRYLIANAYGESAAGVANTMSKFEIIMISGFTVTFWNSLSTPLLLLVAVSGFVVYRYRETRALTLAQFFEMRYSRRFRLFMGMLAFGAGILNYGIFPAVSSKFFVYFLGLPETAWGSVPTFVLIMAAYLACVLGMLMVGGQITLMVTDCIEGLVSLLILLVVVVAVMVAVGWGPVVEVLGNQPPERSMIDPFDAWKVADFNVWYVVMALVLSIYGTMALQNTQGFNAAARTAHESRMAGILGKWRLDVRIMLLLGVTTAAVAFLNHPSFAAESREAGALLAGIGDEQVRKQMTITAALKYLLPVGIKGLFVSTMVMGLLAGDCSHIHSWGSIFVQDVVLPLRGGRPVGTREHLWWLRLAMVGVAVFAFVFSILFMQTHYIALWWQITNAIFISGAGAAIIGGLYWRRGTTGGAWFAVVVGAVLSLAGIGMKQYWGGITGRVGDGWGLPEVFPLNGIQVAFLSAGVASAGYVVVSFLTCREKFNLDRLLHRGAYTVVDPEQVAVAAVEHGWVGRALGFNEHFTRGDKWVAGGLVGWSMMLGLLTLGVAAWNAAGWRWPVEWWARYWFVIGLVVPFVVGAVTFVWFTVAGLKDVKDFFAALRTLKRDASDNGQIGARREASPVVEGVH
jgi:SSS family solute:Na+ symporter